MSYVLCRTSYVVCRSSEGCWFEDRGRGARTPLPASLGKGQMGSALMGSLQDCMFLDRGTFWVLPITYFYLPKSARAYLFPQSVKIPYFCSGPISVDPICPQSKTSVSITITITISIYYYYYYYNNYNYYYYKDQVPAARHIRPGAAQLSSAAARRAKRAAEIADQDVPPWTPERAKGGPKEWGS